MIDYPYTTLEQQVSLQPYPFVEYGGDSFLQAYLRTRRDAVEKLKSIIATPPETRRFSVQNRSNDRVNDPKPNHPVRTEEILGPIYHILKKGDKVADKEDHWLKVLRKLGELGKLCSIHSGADLGWLKEESSSISDYVLLAACLSLHYLTTRNLQSLSTMLKVNDRIIARLDEVEDLSLVQNLLSKELIFIQELRNKLNLEKIEDHLLPSRTISGQLQVIPNLGMVAEDKTRARAYLQSLVASGLLPNFVLVLENQNHQEELNKAVEGRNYFNSSERLITTLINSKISYQVLYTSNFNDQAVVEAIRNRSEEYFIFSGSGILKEILSAGKKLIHAHPGRIPEFRGSTTFLYSLLAEGNCAVSTFIMNEGIDTGDILMIREFPPPEKDVDISRIYDPYIRSLVVVETIRSLSEKGYLAGQPQDPRAGETYFMIHPVLRTLAIGYYTGDIQNFADLNLDG